jgi:hypothetical protein
VGLGYLSLLAASSSFSDSGNLRSPSRFDTLGCGGTSGIFGFAQGAPH